MAAKQLMLPANRAFNSNGLAISGAQAKLYLSGGLTPANFFADSGLVTSLGSTLTANGAGRFSTAYGDSTVGYRLRTLDSDGAVLDDIDPYFFGLTTGVDGANASIAVGTTTTGAAGSNAAVANSGTGTNAILNFTLPAGATGPAGDVAKATDRTALAAITGQAVGASRFLVESGREGTFVWSAANNSANVTKDPQQGVYVAPASDTTGASGAWVRHPGIDNWKNVKWFGAKGDGTTDDHIALQAAITYGSATGVALYAPRGAYRNSALLTSTAPIHLFGDFVSQDSTGAATPASILGSAIYCDAGVGGLLLYYVTNLTAAGSPTIYPSATGSIIERIQFHSAGEGAAHAGIYGVESRAACTLRDVTVRGFGDHGVHIRGSTGGSDGVVFGNVNGSLLENVKSISNAGAGLRISGNDANGINVVGGLFQSNTGYGIDNDSFIGCEFYGPICEGNTAGAIITRRPAAAANTYIGIDTEGGASVLGANDTVIGGGLSEANQGQTTQVHGLLHAYDTFQVDGNLTAGTNGGGNSHILWGTVTSWNGIDIRSGSSLRLLDAAGSFGINVFNDGTNIDVGASNVVPLKASSYKVSSGATVINTSGVLQASAVPAFAGGDVTSVGASLTLSIAANAVTYAKFNQVAASSLVGNPTGSLANAQGITLAADHSFSGTTLQLGAFTGDITKTAGSLATTIAAGAVSLSKMANLAANSILGNNTGSPATPLALTAAQVKTLMAIGASDITAAGSSGNLQYNNTTLGGAANLNVNASGNLTVKYASASTTPGADTLELAPMRIAASAGHVMPRYKDENGISNTLQSHLAVNSVSFISLNGASTGLSQVGINFTAAGTATTRAASSTNQFTRTRRIGYVSSATAGNIAGLYSGTISEYSVGSGTVLGGGGFLAVFKFGCSDAATVAGAHQFCGLQNITAAPTATTDPSTLTNCIGIAQVNGSANMKIVFGGSAAQTAIDLGSNFPAGTLSVDMYLFILWSPPNSNNTVYYYVRNLGTGNETSGTLTGTAGTALPSNSTFLGPRMFRSNNATALAVGLDLASFSIESDFN